PKPHAEASGRGEGRPPSGDGDQHVEDEPDGSEYPVGRVEWRLFEPRIPETRRGLGADESPYPNNQHEKRGEHQQGTGLPQGIERGRVCHGTRTSTNGFGSLALPHHGTEEAVRIGRGGGQRYGVAVAAQRFWRGG